MKDLIDGKLSFIDRQGEIVKLKSFDQIGSLNAHFSGLIAVKMEDKWGFMNQNTQIIISPQFEQVISHIKDNLLLAKKDGEWGFFDYSATLIQPLGKFNDMKPFNQNGLAQIKLNSKWGLIDLSGKIVLQPQFNWIGGFNENGLAKINKGGRINSQGKSVGGKWGLVDHFGRIVLDPLYDHIEDFNK